MDEQTQRFSQQLTPRSMWWKLYFWFYLVISVFGVVSDLPKPSIMWSFTDIYKLTSYVFLTMVLYAYVYRKKLFSQKTWKVALWGFVLMSLYTFFFSTLSSKEEVKIMELKERVAMWGIILGLLIVLFALGFAHLLNLPSYIALYRLAYSRECQTNNLKSNQKDK